MAAKPSNVEVLLKELTGRGGGKGEHPRNVKILGFKIGLESLGLLESPSAQARRPVLIIGLRGVEDDSSSIMEPFLDYVNRLKKSGRKASYSAVYPYHSPLEARDICP